MARKRNKNNSLAPFLWIALIGIIALLYSTNFFQKSSFVQNIFKTKPNTNASSANAKPLDEIFGGLIPKTKPTNTNVITNIAQQATMITNVKVQIYLARQYEDEIHLEAVEKSIPDDKDKIINTLNALIEYPSGDTYNNLIPFNTKIKSLNINGGVAYLDLNESFGYNSFGLLGYQLQIYQIVYTLTQFEDVGAVSFSIEGKTIEYLGGEGYIINNPVYPYSMLPKFSL